MAIKTVTKNKLSFVNNRLRPVGYDFPTGGLPPRLEGFEFGPGFTTASGGTESTSGNIKTSTFTGAGSWIVSAISETPLFEYLIVGGGGAGGAGSPWGGGGGGGGIRYGFSPSTVGTNSITVGTGQPNQTGQGVNGGNSSIGPLVATGGGGGGYAAAGNNGGSGGGGGSDSPTYAGGLNTSHPLTGPTAPVIGFSGGAGRPSYAGGGGGAGSAGGTYVSGPLAGAGGTGFPSTISGSPVIYSAGGGGGPNGIGGNAPLGGGPGNSQVGSNSNPTSYGSGSAGGGGGGFGGISTAGIVIIRWKYQ